MINKQNLWFVTLFSLILVLGIYYVSMDDEINAVLKSEGEETKEVLEINESDVLVSLEVEDDEEKQALMEEYQNVLLDTNASNEEKNNAYESMQELNNNIGLEEKIKSKIKKDFKTNSFVKIKDETVSITIASNEHTKTSANEIIRSVQTLFDKKMYITVKYQK